MLIGDDCSHKKTKAKIKHDTHHYLLYQQRAENPLQKTWMSAKKQFQEASNFKALWGFLLITIPLGFLKKKISPETVAKWNNYTCHPTCSHTLADTPLKAWLNTLNIWAAKTQKGSHLPHILPLLQYWQTDGAFFFCVFICPLIFVFLTMQLSLFVRNI